MWIDVGIVWLTIWLPVICCYCCWLFLCLVHCSLKYQKCWLQGQIDGSLVWTVMLVSQWPDWVQMDASLLTEREKKLKATQTHTVVRWYPAFLPIVLHCICITSHYMHHCVPSDRRRWSLLSTRTSRPQNCTWWNPQGYVSDISDVLRAKAHKLPKLSWRRC